MLKVLNSVKCSGATSSADPWIPLTVSWQVDLRGGPLYLFLTGRHGGFVELKVDPDSGALYALVIVDLPPVVDRRVESAQVEPGSLVPVFDLNLWEWKVTPDYREPSRRDIDVNSELAYSMTEDLLVLWFSESAVREYFACGDIRVGIAASGELVSVVVPRPVITGRSR